MLEAFKDDPIQFILLVIGLVVAVVSVFVAFFEGFSNRKHRKKSFLKKIGIGFKSSFKTLIDFAVTTPLFGILIIAGFIVLYIYLKEGSLP